MQVDSNINPDISNSNELMFAIPEKVRKRDGVTVQEFQADKIETAVRKAWLESEGSVDEKQFKSVINKITKSLPEGIADVELIQDHVEVVLMKSGRSKVAKSYILYRQKRNEARQARKAPDTSAIADYIHFSKYAKYQPDLLRRELYPETVERVEGMHLRKYPALAEDIKWAFSLVRDKRVLPSMRSMQFGGTAIEAVNNRIFNCSFTHVDRLEAFSQAMYLLLAGCGVGYSVQFDHVEKLPALTYVNPKSVVHHVVDDSIAGWADALLALLRSYLSGDYLEFSFHQIRPAGTLLKTSGGRAPGHLRLKESLERIRGVLNGAQGRRLRPIECHHILCHAADAVLSGGIRRSAMISLFSLEDSEMMNAKTGTWYLTAPWLANANNSVILKRDEVKEKSFKRIFEMTRQWGEPGFFFTADYSYGTNPCAEIGLYPTLTITEEVMDLLKARASRGKSMPDVKLGETYTGFAFCNLCEINAAKLTSYEDFVEAAKAATIIGTLQASYTEMPYLGWVSEVIAEREALLGIGMTGMLDSPPISLDADMQRKVAEQVKVWNAEYAAKIGIQAASRTTCVKPSGTTSLELGCVASGHHAHHAKRYIRRVTADELETVFQAFKAQNPHMCVKKPDGKWVIEFAVQAPEGAVVKEDIDAIRFLDMVKSTQQNWVLPGTARSDAAPGLNHNVSNTVTVKSDEWEAVAEYIWKHREYFTGVSLLPATGDKDYAFAPNEAIVTDADEARWNQIVASYKPVDYSAILEAEDGTAFTAEAACAGGACSIT